MARFTATTKKISTSQATETELQRKATEGSATKTKGDRANTNFHEGLVTVVLIGCDNAMCD
ncbi:hypothetical protein F441_11458 [Phytophthora nicotianae CJ01A1]|uniref:Uncharacterized protein n=6 Tax=Phytophthora nicotianae TaxID=4792 RepID=W2PAZ0_PHYN3|nr:hypothetical protein PPTG_24767 [Phytophthora nicotianae INRA-310]ETI43519.1 hypothetical protein F443_11538 [Phytophthora nicotianae P1569]ETK83658.1 hypothetical protein L915_11230 [Phytophthora nicotianae]ETP13408.1 hypothetical protein F441_11458 [Phytophthora nicotianae CJ01A1]ETP41476.1 hypothetical protein F442_11432 [Phytophthora nicotianae P10297]ETL37075.1 hypothetical protein L916_11127 [Phytophthora nicotianae]